MHVQAMPRTCLAIAVTALAAACTAPAPVASTASATIDRSCGPADGPAFDLRVPTGAGILALYAEGSPADAAGTYSVGRGDSPATYSIALCQPNADSCEQAQEASVALRRSGEGTYTGTFDAVFAQGGRVSTRFEAVPADPQSQMLCG